MILGFNPQFKEPILKGTKKHSIRIDKHNRWKPGRFIQLATGVRTKKYNQFGSETCISTQKITIHHFPDSTQVIIDGEMFYCSSKTCSGCFKYDQKNGKENMRLLAKNDGFINIMHFFYWFNKDYKGKIIHWTDFKY